MKRIVDYIKSWLYYPKMEKYFDDRDMSMSNRWKNEKFARFKYAWWHCHLIVTSADLEKWKPIDRVTNIGNCGEKVETSEFTEWYCKFQQEPMKKV